MNNRLQFASVCCSLLATAAAYAAVPHVGVVEGFYGRPWPHQGRLELLKFMGENGLNTYVYGPKDDPYHHAKWREAYPEETAAQFRELLAAAKTNKVDFTWAVHLGDAFTNAAPEAKASEYRTLFAKLDSMYAIGFRSFAAFFDDFGSTNAALHAEIANRIADDFLAKKGDCADLVVCPNLYHGDGSSDYCRTLGRLAGKRVQLMWTGPHVCSEIPKDFSERVTANYRRAPFVWWNWPVNDFNRGKLIMGRLYGVDPYPFAGFVLNPMENLEASKIALYCAARFFENPAAFDSKKTWEEGLVRLYGEKCGKALRVFCAHNSDARGGPRDHEGWLAGWSRLESEELAVHGDLGKACAEIRTATKTLKDELPKTCPALWDEIRHWVDMLDAQAEEGLAALAKDKAAYDAAKARQAKIFDAQKAYFTSLAPEWDKGNCTGCITGTRVLQPLIDKTAKAAFTEQ